MYNIFADDCICCGRKLWYSLGAVFNQEQNLRPLEIQIKIYGFKESLTAQHEFVVIGPQVGQWGLSEDLTGFTSFTFTHICAFFFFSPNNHFTLWSGQSRSVKVKTLIRGMLAPRVAVWSISVLLNECCLRWGVWWSSWPSVGTFSAAGNSDWMPLIHVSVHRHF